MIDARALLVAMLDAAEADPVLGDRVRRVLGGSWGDDLLPLEDAAAIAGESSRVLMDEQRRQRIELVGRRGHWRVRRGELIRWMTTRKATPSNDTATDARAEARASIAAAAARASRGTH